MDRIKALSLYQKVLLLLIAVMIPVFTVLYFVTVSREGFEYRDSILTPSIENGNTVYSGKIKGKEAVFTVSEDYRVEFKFGSKIYGPYTAKEDETAIPENDSMASNMTGVELSCGNEVIFRGGVIKFLGFWYIVNDDGDPVPSIVIGLDSDIEVNGKTVDPMEPSISTVFDLMAGPEMTHKGSWKIWFGGVFVCLVTAGSILFADEFFKWSLFFRIRDAVYAVPSDYEILRRYVSQTMFSVFALIIFILGLL